MRVAKELAALFLVGVLGSGSAAAAWLETSEGCRVFMNKLPEKAEARWSGACSEGMATGQGTLVTETRYGELTRRSEISGRMQEGRFTGPVRLNTGNGDIFEGELTEGRLVRARIRFADGRLYEGDIRNAGPHGQGSMTYPDGGRYVGSWRYQLRHGEGSFVTSKGMQISGTFKNDRLRGRARFVLPDGTWYEGPTRRQRPHGKGRCGRAESTDSAKCAFRNGVMVQ
ncbi:MAG: hypothetical protein AAGL24_09590 [Pseudomonadota bacterium]